ncbi:2-amino-4-hydroxy-6-hydroxymethyldihydropteridine diphosphokinase [Jannaschia sp. LMIT008]|uniref:2-amino-4-hydroxy-6- hydroxymethyldihydropteridine diphosphokinase n=1 Tax=Jannaschia maritima TaxID=3032585 RepID=UPI002811AC69|nr:2-amino-4-hydroxy-6-hydroxymethyldihydropteridine diphosphokinase [Jannaschia sp. LMIT008]
MQYSRRTHSVPCHIAIGANGPQGPATNARRIVAAVARLRAILGRGVAASRLWRSPAWPPGSGPDFVNAAVTLPARMPPRAVLDRLHMLEDRAGRIRRTRWGPRVLDLDLVAVGASVRPDRDTLRRWMNLDATSQTRVAPDALILPHPRMQDRAFVLFPLAELAPRWRHPLTGRTVASMAEGVPLAGRTGLRPVFGAALVNRRLRA